MSHRPIALATAALLGATLIVPGLSPAQANADTVLEYGPIAGGTDFEFPRPDGLDLQHVVDGSGSGLFGAQAAVFGLDSSGTLYGWGSNDRSLVGDGTETPRPRPVPVMGSVGGKRIVSVVEARGSYYALDAEGDLHSWGFNGYGELGVDTPDRRTIPAMVGGALEGKRISSVYSYGRTAFALTTGSELFAWGDNGFGQLGEGTNHDVVGPTAVGLDPEWGTVISVFPFSGRTYALTDSNLLLGWGANFGQLGDGTYDARYAPVPIVQLPAGSGDVTVTGIDGSTFALAANGELFSWGVNDRGQLGIGTMEDALSPQRVQFPEGIAVASLELPYALTTDGAVFAWGDNSLGALGTGTSDHHPLPTPLAFSSGAEPIAHLRSSGDVGIGIDRQGNVYSWGTGTSSVLGYYSADRSAQPARVAFGNNVVIDDVHVAGQAAYGVTDDGRIFAWGSNYLGRLGLGLNNIQGPREMVQLGSGARMVSVQSDRAYATDAAGRLWGWGEAFAGEPDVRGQQLPLRVDGVEVRQVMVGGIPAINPIVTGTTVEATSPAHATGLAPVILDTSIAGVAQPPSTVGYFEYLGSPTVLSHPAPTTTPLGSTLSLRAIAEQREPLTVCWQRFDAQRWQGCFGSVETTQVGDTQTAVLKVVAGEPAGNQLWRAEFTNRFGTATSDPATVNVTRGVWLKTPVPAITGSGRVGEILTVGDPQWTPATNSARFEWRRNGTLVATSRDYVPTEADLGRRVTVDVIGEQFFFPDKRVTSAPVAIHPRGVVSRIAGVDRYATSAAITRASYPDPGNAVFIANGTDFPDALSGAAAAGADRYGSPVLLVPRTGLPAAVKSELVRLKPLVLYVLGGTGAVSTATEAELARYAPVVRMSGTDRYQTSAFISAWSYDRGVCVAYVANGTDFPDALSGAAAAGFREGPILLTARDSLSTSVAFELQRLRPKRIIVLGGTGVVSSAVQSQLRQYTSGSVSRIAGSDRYATSAAISAATFSPGVPVAYIANGTTFPDALSGAAVAGKLGGPVLLTPQNGLPEWIKRELTRLNPGRIVILGGTGAVSTTVANQLKNL